MDSEEQFNNAFYGFIEKVQQIVTNLLNQNQDDADVTQGTAKVWFLLEGLNSYLESSQQEGLDFQVVDLGIDMIAEEILKPRMILAIPDAPAFLSRYKLVKDALYQLAKAYSEENNT